MGLIKEFKEFAVKGNVMDMAVGIIIGAAFTGVVTSLVNDVIMPPIGMALGKVDFKDLKIVLNPANPAAATMPADKIPAGMAEVAIKYGAFLNTVINFLIVAICVFMMVKMMNKLIRKREEAKPA